MDFSILYLQANEQVADTIKSRFDESEIEFLIASQVDEAFQIFNERVVALTLVDANIAGMKVYDFIKKCVEQYPEMLICVCMDLTDAEHVMKVINSGNVKRVFLPPWNIEEIVEGVYATVDEARIKNDFVNRKREFTSEEEVFETTLLKLKNSLLRQQYSYNKIEPFFNKTLDAFISESSSDDNAKRFIKKACNKILLINTAVALKSDTLVERIYKDCDEIAKEYASFKVEKIDSCIMGDVPKNKLGAVAFMIWLLSYLEASNGQDVSLSVDSSYLTSSKCEFSVMLNGTNLGKNNAMRVYAESILCALTQEYDVSNGKTGVRYDLRLSLQ